MVKTTRASAELGLMVFVAATIADVAVVAAVVVVVAAADVSFVAAAVFCCCSC